MDIEQHGTLTGYRYGCRCTECREANTLYMREYQTVHAIQKRAYNRKRYLDNREEHLKKCRQWRKANPGRRNESNRRRRARKASATIVVFSLESLAGRLSMFSGCWMCGREATTVDHVKPLAKGGPHCLSNIRPACLSCNSGKGDRWPCEVA